MPQDELIRHKNQNRKKQKAPAQKIKRRSAIKPTASGASNRASSATKALYDFSDYRDFLGEKLKQLKIQNPRQSMGALARRMGLSTSFLSQLTTKKRHMSLSSLTQVSSALKLTHIEQLLLIFMVLESNVESGELKTFFNYVHQQAGGLLSLNASSKLTTDKSAFRELYAGELLLVIDALVRTHSFEPTTEFVLQSLRGYKNLSFDLLKDVLEDVLKKRKEFALAKTQAPSIPEGAATHERLGVYGAGLNAMHRALTHPDHTNPNAFASRAMPFSREKSLEAMQAFADFCQKLARLSDESVEPEQVYFLNAGLFCVAHAEASSRNTKEND